MPQNPSTPLIWNEVLRMKRGKQPYFSGDDRDENVFLRALVKCMTTEILPDGTHEHDESFFWNNKVCVV